MQRSIKAIVRRPRSWDVSPRIARANDHTALTSFLAHANGKGRRDAFNACLAQDFEWDRVAAKYAQHIE
jgi:hypothetical protein